MPIHNAVGRKGEGANILDSRREPGLPAGKQLDEILGLKLGQEVNDLVAQSLISPLEEFLARPGKKIRGQLVELGYGLAGAQGWQEPSKKAAPCLAKASAALEAIHAGSLVVDDIQDGSQIRRGAPTFHRQHGVPSAINAGNWLYFWPLEGIRSWGLEPERELKLYQICAQALLRAHFGQALDLGVRIDSLPQSRIPSVCLASLELKTGALTALGMTIGAVLGGANDERLAGLRDFGSRFGVTLQMFDDLGNLRARPGDPKRYEDLRLGRPSWVWAAVAELASPEEFHAFAEATRALPDETALTRLLEGNRWVDEARRRACAHLDLNSRELERQWGVNFEKGVALFRELSERLAKAYG